MQHAHNTPHAACATALLPCLLSHPPGNGFFVNSALLMASLLVNAWLCLLLALSRSTGVNDDVIDRVLALLGGLQLLQLGSLSLLVSMAHAAVVAGVCRADAAWPGFGLAASSAFVTCCRGRLDGVLKPTHARMVARGAVQVYVATVWLEDGFLATLKNVLKQLVAGAHATQPRTCVLHACIACALCKLQPCLLAASSSRMHKRTHALPPIHATPLCVCTRIQHALERATGSLLFYVFRGQTTAQAFKRDLAYGGAAYTATGRG